MSEPIRYTGKTEGCLLGSPHWEHPEGEWVKWQDYARLKAKIEKLRLENGAFKRTVKEASAHYDNRLADIARLKAEVERLRKAGDAMAFNYEQMHDFDGVYDSDLMKLVDRWNAAKEGKEQP